MRALLENLLSLAVAALAWLLSWFYYFGDHEDIDYGQILSDFGAACAPGIIGIGPVGQVWQCVKIRARTKAMRRRFGGAPRDFIPYGRLVELNPGIVKTK